MFTDEMTQAERDHETRKLAVDVETVRRRVNESLKGQPIDQAQAGNAAGPAFGVQHSAVTLDNVEQCFAYKPWNQHQVECGNAVREALVAAAKAVLRFVPPGPDRSAAIRKIREARMDANSGITHYGRF